MLLLTSFNLFDVPIRVAVLLLDIFCFRKRLVFDKGVKYIIHTKKHRKVILLLQHTI